MENTGLEPGQKDFFLHLSQTIIKYENQFSVELVVCNGWICGIWSVFSPVFCVGTSANDYFVFHFKNKISQSYFGIDFQWFVLPKNKRQERKKVEVKNVELGQKKETLSTDCDKATICKY